MLRKLRKPSSRSARSASCTQTSIFQTVHKEASESSDHGISTKFQEPQDLNLAFKNICSIPHFVSKNCEQNVLNLDLSYNNFSDLSSLSGFGKLETLILDHNRINCHVSFPSFPSLKMLSINCNEICNLSVFIKNLSTPLHSLRYLCMMNNNAAPSYLNGGSVEQFQDYRYFVISHFAQLEVLDCSNITTEERSQSYAIYGRRWRVRKRTWKTGDS